MLTRFSVLFAGLSLIAAARPPGAAAVHLAPTSGETSTPTTNASSGASLHTAEAAGRVKRFLSGAPDDITVESDVVYRKVDGQKLRLDVYQPRAKSATRRPALIYVHGGAWKYGSKQMSRGTLDEAARRGYVGFSIDYRLLPEGRFPHCAEDCAAAVRWVRAHAEQYNVDPNRIGLVGASAGAHLAALLAVSGERDFSGSDNAGQSSRVQAVVAFFGPYELRGYGDAVGGLINDLIGQPESKNPEAFRQASPISYVRSARRGDGGTNGHAAASEPANGTPVGTNGHSGAAGPASRPAPFPPFLLIHGDADQLVHISQSRDMRRALREAGGEAELIEVHGGTHGLLVGRMNPSPAEFRQRMFDFLDKHLKPTPR